MNTSFYCYMPESMAAEKAEITAKCEQMVAEFNTRARAEYQRIQEEKQALRKSRVFNYSIKDLDGTWEGWKILHKEAVSPVVGCEDNVQWSRPFKIINNVLLTSSYGYKNIVYGQTDAILKQGLVEDNFLDTIPKW